MIDNRRLRDVYTSTTHALCIDKGGKIARSQTVLDMESVVWQEVLMARRGASNPGLQTSHSTLAALPPQ